MTRNRWTLALLYILVLVAAFLCFLGGPLFLADTIEAMTGRLGALTIAVVPLAMVTICSFSLWEDHPLNWGGSAVALGLLGVVLVSAMNAFAVTQFLATPANPDSALMMGGVAAGGALALVYLWLAYRRLRRAARQGTRQ